MADETSNDAVGENQPIKQAPAARIMSDEGRSTVVLLEWPVEFGGTVYEAITIRRVSGAEVDAFIEAVRTEPAGTTRIKPPLIDCPLEVYEAMDDDRFRLEEAMAAFLPKRLQAPLLIAASAMRGIQPGGVGAAT